MDTRMNFCSIKPKRMRQKKNNEKISWYLQTHPFEDGAKLRILNANFTLPSHDGRYEVFHDLIRAMLRVDPRHRPTVSDVLDRLAAIAETRRFNLKGGLRAVDASAQLGPAAAASAGPPAASAAGQAPSSSPQPPRRPPPPSLPPQPTPIASHPAGVQPPHHYSTTSHSGAGLFSSLKGGAGSLLKNLKVLHTSFTLSLYSI